MFLINRFIKKKGFLAILISILILSLSVFHISSNHSYNEQGKQIKSDGYSIIESTVLPDEIMETSGLLYWKGLIWTFNDSGGEPEIYGYSIRDSTIVNTIRIENVTNIDWEDITHDSSNIYIGDFGNNFGIRDTLCIYRIDKRLIKKRGRKDLKSNKILFTYPGYKPNSLISLKYSAYDCEALLWHNDSLYLFTKDWINKTTTLYRIPDEPGKYIATKLATFNCNGLITAADYNRNKLMLLGYKDFKAFLWIFTSHNIINLNSEFSKRIELTTMNRTQPEGLFILNDSTILISSEKTEMNKAMLWKIKLNN